jgi:iron complex outermembrane receptor protein
MPNRNTATRLGRRTASAVQIPLMAVGIAALLCQQTLAQTAASTSEEDASQNLQEVTVVARRVEERSQNVPITVTAISGEALQDNQISRATDLIRLVPTLSVQETSSSGGPNYAIRGIRDGVITYFNDVPVNTLAVEDQFWDLSSIQALAGPQGTLFGRTATGGAILFETQRPTKDFGGYVDASYGNYDYKELNAVVNLPISDMLQVRLGARLEKHDPMVTNIGGGPDMDSRDRQQQRVSILFEPTSDINNYIVFDHSHRAELPLTQITTAVSGTQGLGLSIYPNLLLLGAQQAAFGVQKIDSPYPAYNHTSTYGVSDVFTASLDHGLTFKYIFGYRYLNNDIYDNQPALPLPIEITHQGDLGDEQLTNEVQLLGKSFNNLFNWTLGLFDLTQHNNPFNSVQLFAPVGEPFSDADNNYVNSRQKTGTKAAYGQGTVAITDKVNFTAGMRYSKDTASIFQTSLQPEFFFSGSGPQTCNLAPTGVGVDLANCTQSDSLTSHAITYNVSLDYHLSENMMVYATNRKGYNGGGFNTGVAPNDPPGSPQATYLPEYVTDYELGIKTESSVAGRPVRANLSAYKSEYTQIQRSSSGVTSTGEPYIGIGNGPKAEIYGAILELVMRPIHDITLNLNYGYLRAEYVQGAPGFSEQNTFGQAPEHTLNVSSTYRHDLPVGGAAVAAASWAYQSGITFQDVNIGEPDAFQGGYGIAAAQVGWDAVLNGPVDVSFFVKNLTNKVYLTNLQDEINILSYTAGVHNDPRTFGIELKYHFGR